MTAHTLSATPSHRAAYGKYLASLLLFGSNGVVANAIPLSSTAIVVIRTGIGALFLAAVFFLSRQKLSCFRHKKDLLFVLGSGAAMGSCWLFLYEAYQQIGVCLSSLAYFCGPVLLMAVSPLLFREKISRPMLLGFAVVLVGVVLVNGQVARTGKVAWGLFCGGMSAVLYVLMIVLNKKATHITGLENPTLQLAASFIVALVFLAVTGGVDFTMTSRGWGAAVFLGLVNTGIGCYLYFSSIGQLPAQSVAICDYLEPLSAVFFSVLLLGEHLSPAQILGAVCILGGALVGERLSHR